MFRAHDVDAGGQATSRPDERQDGQRDAPGIPMQRRPQTLPVATDLPARDLTRAGEPSTDTPPTQRRAARRPLVLDPACARLVLCGLLLFGTLVSQLTKPEPPLRDVPAQPSSQHGAAAPGARR